MGRLCFKRSSLRSHCVSPLPTDNTAGVYARRGGFSRQKQDLYLLPIVISDGGIPPMSSTNTLTIKVCGCDVNGALLSCNAEAYILNAGLSTGALIAILACIVILLGKGSHLQGGPYNQIPILETHIFLEVRLVSGNSATPCGYNLRQERGSACSHALCGTVWGAGSRPSSDSKVREGYDEQIVGHHRTTQQKLSGALWGDIREGFAEECRQTSSVWAMICLARGRRRVRGERIILTQETVCEGLKELGESWPG